MDEENKALGLVYSNHESIIQSIMKKRGIYWSRSRSSLWEKGLTSGHHQSLVGISLDCDYDALRFIVKQHGIGFCHLNRRHCWGEEQGGMGSLFRTLEERKKFPQEGSYTNKLLNNLPLLMNKMQEETGELCEAVEEGDRFHTAKEAADVLYFMSVLCVSQGVSLAEVEQELYNRTRRVRRRPGNAKPGTMPASTTSSTSSAAAPAPPAAAPAAPTAAAPAASTPIATSPQ